LLRTSGDPWKAGESRNVSVKGAFVLTDSRFTLRPNAEYVLRVPPQLTKAPWPARTVSVAKEERTIEAIATKQGAGQIIRVLP
jgi:hypothetical protein